LIVVVANFAGLGWPAPCLVAWISIGGRCTMFHTPSDATASKSTPGPAGKGFDKALSVSASDLEALCKDLLDKSVTAGEEAP
jgi:hypothetical protein